MIGGIDHINIDTCDVEATAAFYSRVLGLEARDKPSGNPGVWLYSGDHAWVHVNPVEAGATSTGLFNHVAFSGSNLEAVNRQLKESGVYYELTRRPDRGLAQFTLTDPNNINLEITVPLP